MDKLEELIIEYCKTGNLQGVKQSIDEYIKGRERTKPNNIDHFLYLAASNNNLDILKFILKKYQKAGLQGILNGAAVSGNLEILKYTLKKYKDNSLLENEIENAIDIACDEGHLNIIKFILETNKKRNLFRININELFYIACHYWNIDIIKYLILQGADDFSSGLTVACKLNYFWLLDLMLKNNAILDINRKILYKTPFYYEFVNFQEYSNNYSKYNKCIICASLSIDYGRLDVFKYFSDNLFESDNLDFWINSFANSCYYENTKFLEYIKLKLGDYKFSEDDLIEIIGNTIQNDNFKVLKWLDKNVRTTENNEDFVKYVVKYAFIYDSTKIIDFCLNKYYIDWFYALWGACLGNHLNNVQNIVKKFMDNIKDDYDISILDTALSSTDNYEIFKILLQNGASIDRTIADTDITYEDYKNFFKNVLLYKFENTIIYNYAKKRALLFISDRTNEDISNNVSKFLK